MEKATWEPKSQISPEVLEQWALRQKQEKAGLEEPFDLREWQAKSDRATKEKERRKKLRREKRKRLGIPVPPSENESSDEAMEENEIEDVPAATSPSRKSTVLGRPAKKPARYIVSGSNAQRILDTSSDLDVDASSHVKIPAESLSSNIAPSSKAGEVATKPGKVSMFL